MARQTIWTLPLLWASLLLGYAAAYPSAHSVETRDTNRNGHWRPQIHFTPPSDFMNDPNGLFLDSHGTYHLYYQFAVTCENPGNKSWGHATSTDLYSWVDQPIAIAYTPELGQIWSGSTIVDKDNLSGLFPSSNSGQDNVLAYFTSWKPEEESQYLAYSLDGGQSFKQYPSNPIIDLNRHNFRDPKVVFHKESGKYVIILTLTDSVVFYTSSDLVHWTQSSTYNPGVSFVECPQLLRVPRRKSVTDTTFIDSAWVVVLSSGDGGPGGRSIVRYVVGDFDGTKFTPLNGGLVQTFDFGPDVYGTAFYNFQTQDFIDGKMDAVSISWATNLRYALNTPTCPETWKSTQGGPRHHWLDEAYKLVGSPVAPGVKTVSGATPIIDVQAQPSATASYTDLANKNNPAVEFHLTINVPSTNLPQTVHATLDFASSSTSEKLALSFAISAGGDSPTLEFTMDRSAMQGFDNGGLNSFTASVGALSGPKGPYFTVNGFLDRSIMEVYLNGGAEFGTLLYFPKGNIDGAVLQQQSGGGLSFDFKAVPLRSSWGNGP